MLLAFIDSKSDQFCPKLGHFHAKIRHFDLDFSKKLLILTPLFQLLLPIAQPSYVSVEIGARENDREKKPFKMRYVRGRGNQYYRRYKQKHERRRALRARRRSCFFRVKVDALAYDRKHIKENVRQIVQQSV